MRKFIVFLNIAIVVAYAVMLSLGPEKLGKNNLAGLGVFISFATLACAVCCGLYAEDELQRSSGWWGLGAFVFPFFIPIVLALMPPNSSSDDEDFEDSYTFWLLMVWVITCVAGLVYCLGDPKKTVTGIAAGLLTIMMLFSANTCSNAAEDEERSTYLWALLGFLFPFAAPLLLALLIHYGGGGSSYSYSSPMWRCPKCRARLMKGNVDTIKALGVYNIVGVATCGSCGATFSQRDVYSGKYDV